MLSTRTSGTCIRESHYITIHEKQYNFKMTHLRFHIRRTVNKTKIEHLAAPYAVCRAFYIIVMVQFVRDKTEA